jgi:hypothetical protein
MYQQDRRDVRLERLYKVMLNLHQAEIGAVPAYEPSR